MDLSRAEEQCQCGHQNAAKTLTLWSLLIAECNSLSPS